jgi:hypothetical protein
MFGEGRNVVDRKRLMWISHTLWCFAGRGLPALVRAPSDEQLKRDPVGLLRGEPRRIQSTFEYHAARAIFSANVTAEASDAKM